MEWVDQDENSAVGMGFYDLLGNPKIMGPDFSFSTMATGESHKPPTLRTIVTFR